MNPRALAAWSAAGLTMALATNLEWGRFEPARKMLDNYLTDFTATKGTANEKQFQIVGRFSDC